jgi:hypothetical protein
MSEHEVSRLERSPNALRAVDIPTDPALENSHQDHVHHQDHSIPMHHHMAPHPDVHHQDMQHPDHMHHHDDMGGDDMSSPENQEPFSPRRGYTHKRNEDPPRNAQGKMICKFPSTCPNITFDRRCEWSKHMDKHDRPYKCLEPGCEKLQGFTYSGGLLRHQREVHKMHGGTKKALYCPEPNCKRNSGSGFTRKENLSEHIRRVHRRATDGTEVGIAVQAQNGLDQLEAAAAAAAANEDDGMATDGTEHSSKRKRDDGYLGSNGDDLHGAYGQEDNSVKRLKDENDDLKQRMKLMEDNMAQQQALLQQLLERGTQAVAPTASMV